MTRQATPQPQTKQPPAHDHESEDAAEARTAERRDDPRQNWDRQGLPQGPRYGRAQIDSEHLADPTAPKPGAEEGYPDDRGEFGQHTYGQGGKRTREPYAGGRGTRSR